MLLWLLVVALSFIPALIYASIIYWLDRFEQEPKRLLIGVFTWGAVVATGGAIIYSILFEVPLSFFLDETALDLAGSVLVAPIVEESLKGLAVLIIYWVARREFDSILDGIVYAGITALGFAATENVLYLGVMLSEEGVVGMLALFVLRVVLGGWGHAVYTAWIGIGLAIARSSHSLFVRLAAPFCGWVLAVSLHALHNGMASLLASEGLGGFVAMLLVDWFGWAVMLGIIIWAILREQRWMKVYLQEEVQMQLISPQQYLTASSVAKQFRARMSSLFSPHAKATKRFYRLCGELAQKKHQLASFGEEGGNSIIIMNLRREIAEIARQPIQTA